MDLLTDTNSVVCDVCSKRMILGDGYGLTTTQVTTSEDYWEYMLKRSLANFHQKDPEGNSSIALLVHTYANEQTSWQICEECAHLFQFNHDTARKFNGKGKRPPGNGPADIIKVTFAIAYAWSKLYCSWPQSVQVGNRTNTQDASAGTKCDFCYRIITNPDATLAMMDAEALQKPEVAYLLNRKGQPSLKGDDGREIWVACSNCLSRGLEQNKSTNEEQKPWWKFW